MKKRFPKPGKSEPEALFFYRYFYRIPLWFYKRLRTVRLSIIIAGKAVCMKQKRRRKTGEQSPVKKSFIVVHQCFDVFLRCGDRCNTIIFYQKVQNIRRQERWKRRTKADVFNTKMQEC